MARSPSRQEIRAHAEVERAQAEVERAMNPGPVDPTILYGQEKHMSSQPEDIGSIQIRCKKLNELVVHEEVRVIVENAGFWHVAQMSKLRVEHKLILALVERWRPETHTFHLGQGEMTITLQDVAAILGLRVHGPPITDSYDPVDLATLFEELVGVPPVIAGGDDVKLTQLEMLCRSLNRTPEQRARAYILLVLGGVLFTNTKGSTVSLIYLPFLRDLEQTSQYSWGSAVLAATYRGLCEVSQIGRKELSGCAILVQLWSWEHLHICRPVLEGVLPEGEFPLGMMWILMNKTFTHQVRTTNEFHYRDELEAQANDQVLWLPYTPERLENAPAVCSDQQELFRINVPLIHFNVVEWHRPNRVMRQFGFNQHIPDYVAEERNRDTNLHTLTRKGKKGTTRWCQRHLDYINMWNQRDQHVVHERQPHTDLADYMIWYRTITRRFISQPRQGQQEQHQNMPYVPHGGQIQTILGHIGRGTRIAARACRGGFKFTRKNFQWLSEQYLNTCRSSYEAVEQLSTFEEIVRRAEVVNEDDEIEPDQRDIVANEELPTLGRGDRGGTAFGHAVTGRARGRASGRSALERGVSGRGIHGGSTSTNVEHASKYRALDSDIPFPPSQTSGVTFREDQPSSSNLHSDSD